MQDKIDKVHWMQSGEKKFKGTVGQSGNGTSLPGGRDDPKSGNPDQMSFEKCIQDATCDVLGTTNECPDGVCYEG